MDFIKNLTLDEHHEKRAESHATAPVPVSTKPEGLFDKLSDALHNNSKPISAPVQQVPHVATSSHGSIFDKIGETFGDHKVVAPPPQPMAEATTKHENLLDKIGDALKGEHKQAVPSPPPSAPNQQDLLTKISDSLRGDHKGTPPTHENLLDKIGGALGHGKPAPGPENNLDLLSTISGIIGVKKEEPAKPQGLFDKVNNALGGGAAGEEKEGKLDKVIDLFQEHVLKEGPQHNESAVEQAKDKQIAKTIRQQLEKVTGKK